MSDFMPHFVEQLQQKLTTELNPTHLHITDNSAQHAGHRGNPNSGLTGTHLAIAITSPRFEGLNTLARHRLVHGLLQQEMNERIHALELTLKTPEEAH
jgi:stress-induced morphogen